MARLFLHISSLFVLCLTTTGIGLCSDVATAGPSDVLVRTAVKPQENIVVGQRVILQVDVLAPDGWAQIKRVRDFTVEGAQAVRYESQGTRLNETIQDRSFSGQRYQLSLFPRRDGTVTVPSIPVEVEISSWGGNSGKQSVQTRTPVGEAIKRIIEMSGRDISGMAFTPLRFESTQMVSVYPAEPQVDDSFNRGTLDGKRVETVTYIFTAEGTLDLPEIAIPWWDIDQKKLQRVVLPALRLKIDPSPTASSSANEIGASREQFGTLSGGLTIILLILVILVIPAVLLRKQIYARRQQWQQARRERERFYFRQFVKSARSNDPKAAFNSLMRWLDFIHSLDRIHSGSGAARLDAFLNQYGLKNSMTEAARLEQALNEGSSDWTGKPLVAGMRTARKRRKKVMKTGKSMMILPPLNPRQA